MMRAADKTLIAAACACAAALAVASPAAAAGVPASHGQLLHLAPARASLNATQSNNWFGYNQGSLEQGGKLFNSVTGEWVVPKATPHARGQDESSSVWIGIGGGCVDAGCTLTDPTLIQVGTEQDVAADGTASYSAWMETIPSPSMTISSVSVAPGDRISASISEAVAGSNLWTVTLKNLTNGQSYSSTVPYTSTHATAEWIEENPLVVSAGSTGFAALPNLTSPAFDHATTNGAPVKLTASEQMQLIDSNNNVIGAPSAPDAEGDGFNACAWASSCAAPGQSQPGASSAPGAPATTTQRGTSKKHTTARPKHRAKKHPRRTRKAHGRRVRSRRHG